MTSGDSQDRIPETRSWRAYGDRRPAPVDHPGGIAALVVSIALVVLFYLLFVR